MKLPDATRPALVSFFENVLLDCLDAIDSGAVLGFHTPRHQPKVPVLISQLHSEKYGRCREALFTDLTENFKLYTEGK